MHALQAWESDMTRTWKEPARFWFLLPLLLGQDCFGLNCHGSLRSIATPATQVAAPWLTGRWVLIDEDDERPTPGRWDFEVWAFRNTADLIVWAMPEDDSGTTAPRIAMIGMKARLVQLRTMQLLEVVADPALIPGDPLGAMPGFFVPLHAWARLSGDKDSVVLHKLTEHYVAGRLARKQNRLPHTALEDVTVLNGDASQLRAFVEEAFAHASTPSDSLEARVDTYTFLRAIPAQTAPDSQGVAR
jgi:hypothetical protein